jgi:hypothetical protein
LPWWALIPAGLVCLGLLVSGVWAGSSLGGSPSVAASTYQIVRSGRVVTVGGVKKVYLPARTVTHNGRRIRLPARLVTLTQDQLAVATQPTRTVLRDGRTVTAPGTTVTGPTTTQTSTVTEPATTVTEVTSVTVTLTETGPTTTVTTTITTT